MRRGTWAAVGCTLLLAALVLPAAQPARKRSEAEIKEAELKQASERVERTQRQLQKEAEEEKSFTKALREAEKALSRASGDLTALRTQRAQRAAARQQLVGERSSRQAERDATEADLATQLRAAYFMGRNEPLKLLLNQRSPAEFGRNLTYYGYLGRLRASQIELIKTNIGKIDVLTAQIDEEDAKLADLVQQQKVVLDQREVARKQREQALAIKKDQVRDRAEELRLAQAERKQIEALLDKLRKEAEAAPYDPDSPFGKRRGKLSWPVAGRIVTNYGVSGGGLRSDGIDIDADAGTTVRAVHDGVVRFADWRSGRGNTIFLDHGDGYWSVYGHNENLFKAKGDKVKAGEKIATVGNTGGRSRSGLYFEIRHLNPKSSDFEPVDPRPWFSTNSPPSR